MPVSVELTYSAVLAPLEHPPAGTVTVTSFPSTERFNATTEAVNLMREAAEMVAWINQNIPATHVGPKVRDRDVMIVATFASETDAVAFKTRFG